MRKPAWAGIALMSPTAGSLTVQRATRETPQQRAARLEWWHKARLRPVDPLGSVLKGTEIGWFRANTNRACPTGAPCRRPSATTCTRNSIR